MADQQIIETTPPQEPPKESRAEERIKQLSEKVELTSKERDEFKTLNESVTRERDFYKGYSEVVAKTPAAKDYQEQIKEKVLKGYSVEDATYAVLGKEGKLGDAQPIQTQSTPAGGSAIVTPPQTGQKEISAMTQAERRAQLEKDLAWS